MDILDFTLADILWFFAITNLLVLWLAVIFSFMIYFFYVWLATISFDFVYFITPTTLCVKKLSHAMAVSAPKSFFLTTLCGLTLSVFFCYYSRHQRQLNLLLLAPLGVLLKLFIYFSRVTYTTTRQEQWTLNTTTGKMLLSWCNVFICSFSCSFHINVSPHNLPCLHLFFTLTNSIRGNYMIFFMLPVTATMKKSIFFSAQCVS